MGKWGLNRLLEGNEKLKWLEQFPRVSSKWWRPDLDCTQQLGSKLGLVITPVCHSGCVRRDDDFRKRALRLEEGLSQKGVRDHLCAGAT